MAAWGFLAIAGMGFVLLIIGMTFGFLGSDAEVGGDMDLESDTADGGAEASISLLSIAGIGSSLVGFGLLGYLGALLGSPVLTGVPAGLVGAYICLRATARIRSVLLRRLETGRSVRQSEFVAQVAMVTIPIPPAESGTGQVKLLLHGQPHYASARTRSSREIGHGEQVVVMDQVAGLCLVERLNGEDEGS